MKMLNEAKDECRNNPHDIPQHRSESYSNMLQESNIILLSARDSHFKKANAVIVSVVTIIKHVKPCDI